MSSAQTIAFTGNRLLNAFHRVSREHFLPYLETVDAQAGEILCEAGTIPKHAYFPDGAVVGLVNVMKDGRAIEIINIGREGEFGFLWGFHKRECFTRAVVRLPGIILRFGADLLRREYERNEHIRGAYFRYAEAQIIQLEQTLACNALHTTKERFCRLLLTMSDKWDGESLPCTHELLAEALGANRKSVTLAAQHLQKNGLIGYSRGRIKILDRMRLEKDSCECYSVIKNSFDSYFKPAQDWA